MTKRNQSWENKFNELKAYYAENGTFHISSKIIKYKALRLWANAQRQKYNNHKFINRRQRLEEIGFVFNPNQEIWINWYKQLLVYKGKYGHTNVPYRNKDFYGLSIWVYNQKRTYRQGTLTSFRTNKLISAGVNMVLRKPGQLPPLK